jgi:hypothetical protein
MGGTISTKNEIASETAATANASAQRFHDMRFGAAISPLTAGNATSPPGAVST